MLDYEKNIPKIRYIIKKILPLHTELERKEFSKENFFLYKPYKTF